MEQRERLRSRLGFILLSAGCAIGIGNVWKFPYITGLYGGGAFVLLYILFLVIMGVPMLTIEFAIGRASRKSPLLACRVLEKPGQKWHLQGYLAMAGNYLLMMFYTTVSGWMLHYFVLTARGGWGWENLLQEANAGKGMKMPRGLRFYMTWILPVILLLILIIGIVEKFA